MENAIHKDFNGINGAIYRVDGDGLKTADEIFKASKILKYRFKGIVKRLGKNEYKCSSFSKNNEKQLKIL